MVVSEAIQTKVSGLPGCMYIDSGSVFVPLVASPIIEICWLEIECFKCLLSGSWPYNTSDDSVAMETGLIDEIGFYTVDVLLSLRFGRKQVAMNILHCPIGAVKHVCMTCHIMGQGYSEPFM